MSAQGPVRVVYYARLLGPAPKKLICESSIGELDRSFLGFVIKSRLKKGER